MSKVVLAVVAHPDDESLLMAGTLAKHVDDGDDVYVSVLSDGVGSRFKLVKSYIERTLPHVVAAQRRLEHFHAACDAIGIVNDPRHRILHVIFQDQRADRKPQIEINQCVERIVADVGPDRAYTHYAGDLNHDHRRVSEAVQVATRGVCEVWCAEPEWPDRGVGTRFAELTMTKWRQLVDVERKLAACACYVDELRDPPHPRSLQEIRKRTEKGEAFEVIR